MHVLFLGTSSGVPTSQRGLSAVALCLEGETLLFDCGEGTQMQLKKAEMRSSKISKVFISHMHGDHINGLIGLLMSMDMESRVTPVQIYGPPELPKLMQAWKRFLRTNFTFPVEMLPLQEGLLCETKAYTVTTAALQHRVVCHGFAFHEHDKPGRFDVTRARELGIPEGPLYGKIQRGETVTLPDGRSFGPQDLLGETRPGRKVAFVTDTRPCDNAVRLAYGSDVLIHEATFADDLREKAVETGHSTASEAARVAQDANVDQLILTHFSSRYHNERFLQREARKTFPRTYAAADFFTYEVPVKEPQPTE